MRGSVHLDAHALSSKLDHQVEAVALTGAHLLLHLEAQLCEHRLHLPLQPRGRNVGLVERREAALAEWPRQGQWGGSVLLAPQLPLVEASVVVVEEEEDKGEDKEDKQVEDKAENKAEDKTNEKQK